MCHIGMIFMFKLNSYMFIFFLTIAILFDISVVIKSQSTGSVSDKVKNRLEQLDDFEEVFSETC